MSMAKEQAQAATEAAYKARHDFIEREVHPLRPDCDSTSPEGAAAWTKYYALAGRMTAPYRKACSEADTVLRAIKTDEKWRKRMTPAAIARMDQWVEQHRAGLTSAGLAGRCDICGTRLGNPASMTRRMGPDCWAAAQWRLGKGAGA